MEMKNTLSQSLAGEYAGVEQAADSLWATAVGFSRLGILDEREKKI